MGATYAAGTQERAPQLRVPPELSLRFVVVQRQLGAI